jgi:hypothetical protein
MYHGVQIPADEIKDGCQYEEEYYYKKPHGEKVIDELGNKGQYGKIYSSEQIHVEEISANYKDREKHVGEPLKKDEAADGWMTKVGQETTSQIIYC